MTDKIAYNRLPIKYKIYGDMPTQLEIQEAIDNLMLFGKHKDIEEWEKQLKPWSL